MQAPQGEQAKGPVSQSLPARVLSAYFLGCCLSVCFLITLLLRADCLIWNTDGVWHIFNYWEPLRTNTAAWIITKVWENIKNWARLINKVDLLQETHVSKLGEVALLSSAWKLTQRIKEMRKQGTMFKTHTHTQKNQNLQKLILIKCK